MQNKYELFKIVLDMSKKKCIISGKQRERY